MIYALCIVFMVHSLAITVLWRASYRRANAAHATDVLTHGADGAVSVVIPAYNEAAHIAECIHALAVSGLRPQMVVVVDDGSSDGTDQIATDALTLHSLHYIVVRHSRNRGKAAALNTGLSHANSQFFVLLDADTHVAADCLQNAFHELKKSALDAVAFRIKVFDPRNTLERIQSAEYNLSLQIERSALGFLGAIGILPGAGAMYRASSLNQALPIENRTLCEDTDCTLSLQRSDSELSAMPTAIAATRAPADLLSLYRQRRRWAWGNIQCGFFHAVDTCPGTRKFRLLVLPLFLMANVLAPVLQLMFFLLVTRTLLSGDVLVLGLVTLIGATAPLARLTIAWRTEGIGISESVYYLLFLLIVPFVTLAGLVNAAIRQSVASTIFSSGSRALPWR